MDKNSNSNFTLLLRKVADIFAPKFYFTVYGQPLIANDLPIIWHVTKVATAIPSEKTLVLWHQ